MAQQIENVTIVGGGTAGWLAANLLTTYFNRPKQPPRLKITLIESPNVKTVGVGEATVPGMPRLLQQMGINEREFFRRCNASFKLGVDFVNWNHKADGSPVSFINPFNSGHYIRGHNPGYYFQAFGRKAANDTHADDIVEAICPAPEAITQRKGPRLTTQKDFESPLGYAYHLDAGLFAKMLQEIGTQRGVVHISDDVVDVKLDERGFVSSLELKERGSHPIELVIDCTGFKGLIINEALGEPFEPYTKYLMNDRALAVQIPHEDPTNLEPCTRSTALGAGWVWNVPLHSRRGTGYVFSSAHRTDEEAMREFLAHLGKTEDEVQPRAIPIRVGRTRRAFVKNCLALGLSGGFIEPLESTAIFMIEMGIRSLFSYFPDMNFDPVLADRYNKISNDLYDEVRDFIVLHYYLNNRTDSDYWIAAREDMEIPERLLENLKIWKYTLPTSNDLPSEQLFTFWNYIIVLFSKGFYPLDHVFPNARGIDEADWASYIRQHRASKKTFLDQLPSSYELISHLRGDTAPAPAWALPAAGTVPLPGQGGDKRPVLTPGSDESALL